MAGGKQKNVVFLVCSVQNDLNCVCLNDFVHVFTHKTVSPLPLTPSVVSGGVQNPNPEFGASSETPL